MVFGVVFSKLRSVWGTSWVPSNATFQVILNIEFTCHLLGICLNGFETWSFSAITEQPQILVNLFQVVVLFEAVTVGLLCQIWSVACYDISSSIIIPLECLWIAFWSPNKRDAIFFNKKGVSWVHSPRIVQAMNLSSTCSTLWPMAIQFP